MSSNTDRPEVRATVALCTERFDWNRTDLRITAGGERDRDFDSLATLRIETGACGMQVYATADECRRLAKAFADAADVIDKLTEPVAPVLPVAESA